MKTELIVNDPKIEAGKKIECNKYQVRHFRIHKCLETLARLSLFLIESRSNNSSSIVTKQDSQTIRQLWELVKTEFARAKKFKGAAPGTLERVYHIVRPTPSEIQRVMNLKVKSVSLETDHLMEIFISCDSAFLDVYLGDQSQSDLDQAMANYEDFLNNWIGDGKLIEGSDPEKPMYNTGLVAPEGLRILGQCEPDVDLDLCSHQEPSQDVQPPRAPDTPDV
jgi:hypothetical protein